MAAKRNDEPGGVFCLEGQWDEDLTDRTSVLPILQLLDTLDIARYIRRDVATRDQFEYLLDTWCDSKDLWDKGYTTLYLACHGDKGSLWLGRDYIGLDRIAELIDGSAKGCSIHFGSCLSLRSTDESLKRFARDTGARSVTGYTKSVGWLDSATFECHPSQRLDPEPTL